MTQKINIDGVEVDLSRLDLQKDVRQGIAQHYVEIMDLMPAYVSVHGEYKVSTCPTDSYGWNANFHHALMQACQSLREVGFVCTTKINHEVYDTVIWKPRS